MLPSKFEANLTLRLRVKHASFSLFQLASLCSNAYFRVQVISHFLADWLVFIIRSHMFFLGTVGVNIKFP